MNEDALGTELRDVAVEHHLLCLLTPGGRRVIVHKLERLQTPGYVISAITQPGVQLAQPELWVVRRGLQSQQYLSVAARPGP